LRRPVTVCATYSSFFFLRSDRLAVLFFAAEPAGAPFAVLLAVLFAVVDRGFAFAVLFFAGDPAAERRAVAGLLAGAVFAVGFGFGTGSASGFGRPSHLGVSPSFSGCGFCAWCGWSGPG
jgi:hypothetical protein